MGGSANLVAGAGAASSLFGGMGGNDISGSDPSGAMNSILGNALNQSLPYSQNYTNQAVGAQNDSLQAALGELNQAMTSANNSINNGFQTSQALQTPYRNAGYQALDQYQDSLHMSRAKIGSQAVADALTNNVGTQQQLQGLLQGQQGLDKLYDTGAFDPSKLTAAPTLQGIEGKLTNKQLLDYVNQNSLSGVGADGKSFIQYVGEGVNGPGFDSNPNGPSDFHTAHGVSYSPAYGSDNAYLSAQQALNSNRTGVMSGTAQPLLSQAQDMYKNQAYNYDQLGQFLQNQFTPNQQNISLAYNRGLFNNLGTQKLY